MIKKLIGSLALTLLFAASANAATLTIMGPASATVGDSFQLEIWGDFGAEGLIAGGITFGWDSSLVQLDMITRAFGATDFSCPGSPGCPPPTANSAPIVWGEFLADLIAPNAGPKLMATLNFTAIGPIAEALATFSMADNPNLTGGWFGSGFAPIDIPSFGGFTMDVNSAVVPLPAAVWFMIGGLGTLLGFRRK